MKRFFYSDFIGITTSIIDQAETKSGHPVDPDFKIFLAKFYAEAIAGTLLDWVKHKESRDPDTFFYESVWNICLLILMLIVSRKQPKSGTLTCMYFVIYGAGRFWIEGLRTDSLYVIPGLRASQLLSLLLIGVGVGIYLSMVRKGKFNQPYSGKYSL